MTARRVTAWRMLLRMPSAVASLVVVLFYLLLAVGTEGYSIYCEQTGVTPIFQRTDDTSRYAPPSREHWLGTDYQGRDVLLRAAAGSATAVKVGVIAGFIAVFIGVALGAIAGFYGGKFDDWVVWAYSTFASMPTLLFILAFALLVSRNFLSAGMMEFAGILGSLLRAEPGMLAVYLAIGLTGWVTLFAGAVMLEVIVSYLGFGVQSAPSWGVMISDGQDRLWRGIWWEIAAATGFMFLLVLALNVLGDALRDALDPRHRQ